MNERLRNTRRLCMLFIAIVAWLALGLQWYLLIKNAGLNGLSPLQATGRFFSYFTILTNLLVAVCLSLILVNPGSKTGRFFSKPSTATAIALYILIVGLIYNTILRFIWQPAGLQKWVDEALHVGVPLLFVLYWVFFVSKGFLKWSYPFYWLLYPALYLAFALLTGRNTGFYTYPFINVPEIGVKQVIINSLGIMILFIAAGFLLVVIDRKMHHSRG